jgi:hypothetical protein
MNLGYGAVRTEVADAQGEGGIELRGIEEMEEGALRVYAGDYGVGEDFFAVGEDKTGDSAVFDVDVADFGIGADFGAGLARGFGERAGEGTESSVREGGGADGMRIGGGA